MSSFANKQDMSMDDILASIRSYVSEGQSLPKSEAISREMHRGPENNPYKPEVIHLTDEVPPIELINPIEINPVQTPETIGISANPNNPFQKLQSEINAILPPQPTLSPDELLNQLATPLIKNWLDKNLLRIVENIVEKEIERIRRG